MRLPGTDPKHPKVDPVERWFSVAMGAVLLSPGAMAAGWTDGYEGALKGAASRLGVRLALLTLGALLGPVGWAGLVLYVVSDAVLLVLTGGSQLKRLRDQVAERLRGQLVAQVDAARGRHRRPGRPGARAGPRRARRRRGVRGARAQGAARPHGRRPGPGGARRLGARRVLGAGPRRRSRTRSAELAQLLRP